MGWLLLALGALLIGFSKTAINGVAMISVAIFATVLPARPSGGAVLLLLLVGDAVAVVVYSNHAHWPTLVRLWPSVLAGVVVGAVFIHFTGDTAVRRTMGVILVGLVALQLVNRRAAAGGPPPEPPEPAGRLLTAGTGTLAGFTSMVANAGGAVMNLYLLRARTGVLTFLGTGAWFFVTVNLAKLPFTIALGLVTRPTLVLLVVLAPAVLLGTWAGRIVIPHVSAERFERIVLAFTALSALNLLR